MAVGSENKGFYNTRFRFIFGSVASHGWSMAINPPIPFSLINPYQHNAGFFSTSLCEPVIFSVNNPM